MSEGGRGRSGPAGIRYSSRNPDPNFPYGYGNMRYVSSLISGCGILAFGCGLSMYHGISGLLHPQELEPMTYVSGCGPGKEGR